MYVQHSSILTQKRIVAGVLILCVYLDSVFGPFYGKKALRVKRALSNIAKNDVMGKKKSNFH